MATHLKNVDIQISQISRTVSANTQPGKFPSNTIINPNDCKAIHLRSGTSYEGPPMPSENEDRVAEKRAEEKELVEENETVQISTPRTRLHIHLHHLQLILQLKKVNLNIPLVEALQEMPTYAKFLKDVLSKKKRWTDYETVNIYENCSAIIQKKLPTKLKDPDSFNISCVIGNDKQTKALCDLGASINLMPLSFFRKMKIGTL
ncbi:uncharacterized protein LOC121754577 [Salvia splendens]|uniref:uncharacterized protein LOC121754577 n=1 Tax=Salvia splendens TaxID=180675 RepID=UPI001C251564|nr:uncharacterized protein LOC121754577 [Salvia splendens]